MGIKMKIRTLLPLLALFVIAGAAATGLVSCAEVSSQPEPSKPQTSEQAGDSALPELDGEYAYVLAKVLSKDAERGTIEIEVEKWQDGRPFSKGSLAVGSTGTVSCSELVFFPAGIGDGSTVVVCVSATDGAFPLTAYTIEKLALFEERVDRWFTA
ncbi:hypothetical protein [Raoultibacter phocaeensis]|uniref:hypothetical protein n=1 Tax=Raoultibacter phocaeensis TaxID=2479841 RepID=UPI001119F9A4|nr:hypothetical protein [Raoultibacter phocaeensis]